MAFELDVSFIVPSNQSLTRLHLSSTGSLGPLSPLPWYDWLLRLPTALPAPLWSSLGSALPCASSSLPGRSALPARAWGLFFRCPGRSLGRRSDLPGSWGVLLCVCPVLGPRHSLHTSPVAVSRFCPRRRDNEDLCVVGHFGARSHGFRTRCLRFAARVAPGPRNTRFRLVASLCRTGLVTRRTPLSVSVIVYMTSP
jgi:hypothetical protein